MILSIYIHVSYIIYSTTSNFEHAMATTVTYNNNNNNNTITTTNNDDINSNNSNVNN